MSALFLFFRNLNDNLQVELSTIIFIILIISCFSFWSSIK